MEITDAFSEEEIRQYMAGKKFYITPEEVLKYWRKKKWKTKKGTTIKTLSAAISCLNGIKKENDRKKKKIAAKKEERKLIREHKPIKTHYTPYADQLNTPEWKAFRQFIFVVRGKQCEKCGRRDRLQIHHLRYITGRMAWEYLPFDVLVLCDACHKKIHNI